MMRVVMSMPRSLSAAAHRVQRHSLDHLQPEPLQPRYLTRVVRQKADLVQAEVEQDLRPQAELAERLAARRKARRGVPRRHRRLELAHDVAPRRNVDERAASLGL